MPKKLELNKETLRQLSDEDLTEVSGGHNLGPLTQSPACPSGATWFASCESNIGTCG